MYYSISIGTGAGVIFLETTMQSRVKHEVNSLPKGWTINIWEFDENNNPVRKCQPEEFMEDVCASLRKETPDEQE